MNFLETSRVVDLSPLHSQKLSTSLWKIPPSAWKSCCHALVDQVSRDVDQYFLSRWDWQDEKSKRIFVAAGFSHVTYLYFPLARDGRIDLACKLLTVLFFRVNKP